MQEFFIQNVGNIVGIFNFQKIECTMYVHCTYKIYTLKIQQT
jgi:hypothetical protein